MALDNVARYSFPFNHLINVQVVKNVENADSLKPMYFGMVSLIPGVSDNNNRTYDYSQATHVKYSLHELEGLSFALKQYAGGNINHLGYVKFTKSGTGSKVVSLQVGTEENDVKGNKIITRVIAFNVSANNNTKRVQLSCDNAFAMGEMIHQMFLIGCQYELTREVNSDSYKSQNSSTSNKQSNFNTNSNTNSFNANTSAADEDDNSSFLGNQFGGGGFTGGNPFS
jgi:hypothetical protein